MAVARRGRRAREVSESPPAYWVRARLDDDVWKALIAEATLMGDVDQLATIRRRLTYGAWLAPIIDRRELAWRAIREGAEVFEFELDSPVLTQLQLFAEKYGYELEVVIATILASDAYKPPEVASAERAVAPGRGRSLRWEPGRGHIYPVRFELPGYQLIFLKLLSPSVVKREEVLEEALLALARQVQHVDHVAGFKVTDEARAFARKMVDWPG